MTTGSAILANDGDGSVSGTTFHTYTACTQYLWWEKRLSPSRGSYCGSRQQTLLSCEQRTAHTDTILSTVDIVFVCFILSGLVLGEVIGC